MSVLKMGTTITVLALLGSCDGGGTTPPPMGTETGSITGMVQAEGAAVQGASVALQGGATVATSASGTYDFANVPVGARQLTLTVPAGFNLAAGHTATKTANVSAGQTATVSWQLTAADPGDEVLTITLNGTTFTPSEVTIPVGTTVRWVSQGVGHTITPDNPSQPGAWQEQEMNVGSVFEHTFTVAGTFDYRCVPHFSMGMTGRIVVQ
jgi:plastocyanin